MDELAQSQRSHSPILSGIETIKTSKRRQTSCQARSGSQAGAGLGSTSGVERPPDSRKRHVWWSTRPSFCIKREQRRKENSSLCRSNRLRHTLLYNRKVKYSLMFWIRVGTSAAAAAFSTAAKKMPRNHSKEYLHTSENDKKTPPRRVNIP